MLVGVTEGLLGKKVVHIFKERLVTAYGLLEGMTFPLTFEVSKPKQRLLADDTSLSQAPNSGNNDSRIASDGV